MSEIIHKTCLPFLFLILSISIISYVKLLPEEQNYTCPDNCIKSDCFIEYNEGVCSCFMDNIQYCSDEINVQNDIYNKFKNYALSIAITCGIIIVINTHSFVFFNSIILGIFKGCFLCIKSFCFEIHEEIEGEIIRNKEEILRNQKEILKLQTEIIRRDEEIIINEKEIIRNEEKIIKNEEEIIKNESNNWKSSTDIIIILSYFSSILIIIYTFFHYVFDASDLQYYEKCGSNCFLNECDSKECKCYDFDTDEFTCDYSYEETNNDYEKYNLYYKINLITVSIIVSLFGFYLLISVCFKFLYAYLDKTLYPNEHLKNSKNSISSENSIDENDENNAI